MERAQITKPEGKVQFADEEPNDPHETQEPSDKLVFPAKDTPAEMNPTDDHGPDDQQKATTKVGVESSLDGESTLLTPIKSSKSIETIVFQRNSYRGP